MYANNIAVKKTRPRLWASVSRGAQPSPAEDRLVRCLDQDPESVYTWMDKAKPFMSAQSDFITGMPIDEFGQMVDTLAEWTEKTSDDVLIGEVRRFKAIFDEYKARKLNTMVA